jgi:hypothetical protein
MIKCTIPNHEIMANGKRMSPELDLYKTTRDEDGCQLRGMQSTPGDGSDRLVFKPQRRRCYGRSRYAVGSTSRMSTCMCGGNGACTLRK